MKYKYAVILAAAAALSSGCAEKDSLDVICKDGYMGGCVTGVVPDTKTSLDIALNVVWMPGDRIRIMSEDAPDGADYVTESAMVSKGAFNPESSAVVSDVRYAVYPSGAVDGKLSSGTVMIDLSGAARQNYSSQLGMGSDVASLPMCASSSDDVFAFSHLYGGLELRLSDYQQLGLMISSVEVIDNSGLQIAGKASLDFESGKLILANGGDRDRIVVDCGEGASISSRMSEPAGFVAFLPAGEYPSGLTFRMTDTEGRVYTKSAAQPITVHAGIVTPLRALPLTLYYGRANCYNMSSAGTVQIDITPYYTFSDTFAYDGNVVQDASGKTFSAAASAKVIWQQASSDASGDVVGNPAVAGNVMDVPVTGVSGNAVVAVCDKSGTVLWSWHIWSAKTSDMIYSNEDLGVFSMLDIPLGATASVSSASGTKNRNAYGVFYQWGRKDPFPRPLDAPRVSSGTYETRDCEINRTEKSTSATGTVGYAVRNPDVRLLSSNDWHYGYRINALWGNPGGTVDDVEAKGAKTVYDPCPEGYRVADMVHYKGLKWTSAAECNGQYGHLFVTDAGNPDKRSYYSTGGYLLKDANGIKYNEVRGYLHQSVPGATGVYCFYYNNANNSWSTPMDRAGACPVRCVKM